MRVVQFCHPDWRGVRASAAAFGAPVLERTDLAADANDLVARLAANGTERIVIQGWPPGAAALATAAHRRGLRVAAVSHAALTQHGTDAGEADRVSEVLDLARTGAVDRVGFVKAGLAPVFVALGYPAYELINRVPKMPTVIRVDLGAGDHVGIFLFPYWRKNVTTQLAAAMLLGATAHVMQRPDVRYLPQDRIVEHGELAHDRFLPLLGSMGLNLHVTLSECHPMTPMESYGLGVPCLISRTSRLFGDDADLLDLTSVIELDDPQAIAHKAATLRAEATEAVTRARASLARLDVAAAARWDAFVA
jgi:hypothetical protein